MIIYYNPECSKCQEAGDLLREQNCSFEIRNYLLLPPTREEILHLIKLLGCKAKDLVRTGEPIYIEKCAGRELSEEEFVDLITEFPILLQRPIVVDGEKAIIGRPPKLVLQLIK